MPQDDDLTAAYMAGVERGKDLLRQTRAESFALAAGLCVVAPGVVGDEGGTPRCPLEAVVAAAQAVVERWDTPLWKDAPHTAEAINRLRNALAAAGRTQ